ncbi:hypothetical protein [Endozoicomonas sp. SCSIO W0465]|uniref:hypothetical protein n=1 Tax=Endozoicomonas sp. SCSIO W0465 TaxID=2918516 RepID=UPI0020757A3B|nr:hypothetical protein [Endozoicomonas sp. SCSIO W0465]USE37168.1 hypothetical protein MJO57_02755 [Endozoicomonas sp. SCSIO W0465]
MINSSTSPSTVSPNFAVAMKQIQHQRLNKQLSTAISEVEAIISERAMRCNCPKQDFVRLLTDYFVCYYQLPKPQLSTTSPTAQNPTAPDEWNWASWESKHYEQVPKSSKSSETGYAHKSREKKNQIIIELNSALGCDHRFKICKELSYVKNKIGEGILEGCNDMFELSNLLDQQLLSLTPLIHECIQAGLFTEEFINNLYSM